MKAKNDFQPYTGPGNLKTNCANSIMFFNQGNVTALINNALKVAPGSTFSISQVDPSIIDATAYQLRFDLTDAATTGTDQQLLVITTTIN